MAVEREVTWNDRTLSDEELAQPSLIRMAGSDGHTYEVSADKAHDLAVASREAGVKLKTFIKTVDNEGNVHEISPFDGNGIKEAEDRGDALYDGGHVGVDYFSPEALNAGAKRLTLAVINPWDHIRGIGTAATTVARGLAKGTIGFGLKALAGIETLAGQNYHTEVGDNLNMRRVEGGGVLHEVEEGFNKAVDFLTPDFFELTGEYHDDEDIKNATGSVRDVAEMVANLKGIGSVTKAIQARRIAAGATKARAAAEAHAATGAMFGLGKYDDVANDPNGPGGARQQAAALIAGTADAVIFGLWNPFKLGAKEAARLKPFMAATKKEVTKRVALKLAQAFNSGASMATVEAVKQGAEQIAGAGTNSEWGEREMAQSAKAVGAQFLVGSAFVALDVAEQNMGRLEYARARKAQGDIPEGYSDKMKVAMSYQVERNRRDVCPKYHNQAAYAFSRFVRQGGRGETFREGLSQAPDVRRVNDDGSVVFDDGSVWRPDPRMHDADGTLTGATITVSDGTILSETGELLGYRPRQESGAQPRAENAEPRAENAEPRVENAEPRVENAQPRVEGDKPASNALLLLQQLDEGKLPVEDVAVGDVEPLAPTENGNVIASYDPAKAKPIVVWEDLEGNRHAVTGGKRISMAAASGAETVKAVVVREADGWSEAEARGLGATENLREGHGGIKNVVEAVDSLGADQVAELAGWHQANGSREFASTIRKGLAVAQKGGAELKAALAEGRIDESFAYNAAQVLSMERVGEGWEAAQRELAALVGKVGPEEMDAVLWGLKRRLDAGEINDFAAAIAEERAKYNEKKGGKSGQLDSDAILMETEDNDLKTLGEMEAEQGNGELGTGNGELGTGNGVAPELAAAEGAGQNKAVELRPVAEKPGTFATLSHPNARFTVDGEKKVVHVEGLAEADFSPGNAEKTAALVARIEAYARENGLSIGINDDAVMEAWRAAREQIKAEAAERVAGEQLKETTKVVISELQKSFPDAQLCTTVEEFNSKGGLRLTDSDGRNYGAMDPDTGKIYLNPEYFGTKVGLETSIHEFGHVGIIECEKVNKPVYDRGVKLASGFLEKPESAGTGAIRELVDLITNDRVYSAQGRKVQAEELLAQLIGKRGAAALKAETNQTVVAKVKAWLVEFWNTFGKALGLKDITPEQAENMTLEDVADAIRAEMFSGRKYGEGLDRVEFTNGGAHVVTKPVRIRKKLAGRRKAVNEFVNRMGGADDPANTETDLLALWVDNGGRLFDRMPFEVETSYSKGATGVKKTRRAVADEFAESTAFYRDLDPAQRKVFFGSEKLETGPIGEGLKNALEAAGITRFTNEDGTVDYEAVIGEFKRQWTNYERGEEVLKERNAWQEERDRAFVEEMERAEQAEYEAVFGKDEASAALSPEEAAAQDAQIAADIAAGRFSRGGVRFSRAKAVSDANGNESYKVESNGKMKRYKTPKEALEDFIKELDGQTLNEEQQGIYDVVTGVKNTADIRKNDLGELVKFHKGGRGKGAGKIIAVHYAGKRGKVTAKEVIDIGQVIRSGTLDYDGTAEHPYSHTYTATASDGAELKVVIDLDKKGNEAVINFYSDRKTGNGGQRPHPVSTTTSSSPQSIPNSAAGAQGGRKLLFSRGGIFTGTAADYANRSRQGGVDDGPSLKKIGTGEGSQVYGWGLYGSTERGVAERYAKNGRGAGGKDWIKEGRNRDELSDVEKEAASYLKGMGSKKAAIERLKEDIEWFEKQGIKDEAEVLKPIVEELSAHGDEYREQHENVYEQTFFTNREPGDESHLLKWYDAISDENWDRVLSQADKEGLRQKLDGAWWFNFKGDLEHFLTDNGNSGDAIYESLSRLLGSPKAASEFLARAGIDGVKYPVDSYGGKGVKDGDEVGWNYVSFRDDNIRVDHKWRDGQLLFSRAVGSLTGGKKNAKLSDVDQKRLTAVMRGLGTGELKHPRFTKEEAAASQGAEHEQLWNYILSLESPDMDGGGAQAVTRSKGGTNSQGGERLGRLRRVATRYGSDPREIAAKDHKYFDRGAESRVYDSGEGTVIKVRQLNAYDLDGVKDALAKIVYHNYLFPKDAYRLHDIAVWNNKGHDEYYLVLEQPLVTPKRDAKGNIIAPTEEQILRALAKTGQRFAVTGGYYDNGDTPSGSSSGDVVDSAKMVAASGDYAVYDFKPGRNTFIDAETGEVRFIDPRVDINDPTDSFAYSKFGKRRRTNAGFDTGRQPTERRPAESDDAPWTAEDEARWREQEEANAALDGMDFEGSPSEKGEGQLRFSRAPSQSGQEYTYSALTAKPDMSLVQVDAERAKQYGDHVSWKLADARKSILAAGGRLEKGHYIIDMEGEPVEVGKKGLLHGKHNRSNDFVYPILGEVLKNAVRVNELGVREGFREEGKKDDQVNSKFVYLGAAALGDVILPVRIQIDRKAGRNEIGEIDVLKSINAKVARAPAEADSTGHRPPSISPTQISIANLIGIAQPLHPQIFSRDVAAALKKPYQDEIGALFSRAPEAKLVKTTRVADDAGQGEQTPGAIAASRELSRQGAVPLTTKGTRYVSLPLSEMHALARYLTGHAMPDEMQSGRKLGAAGKASLKHRKVIIAADVLGTIDKSDMAVEKEFLKQHGFLRHENANWCATHSPSEVRQERARSEDALSSRLEALADRRTHGKEPGGMAAATRVYADQLAKIVMAMPHGQPGVLGAMQTVAGALEKRVKGNDAEADAFIKWMNGGVGSGGVNSPTERKLEMFSAFLIMPKEMESRAKGWYDAIRSTIAGDKKLTAAFREMTVRMMTEQGFGHLQAEIEKDISRQHEQAVAKLNREADESIKPKSRRAQIKEAVVLTFDDKGGAALVRIGERERMYLGAQRKLLEQAKTPQERALIKQQIDAYLGDMGQKLNTLALARAAWERGSGNADSVYDMKLCDALNEALVRDGLRFIDLSLYLDQQRVIETKGLSGSRGESARQAQFVLDAMKKRLGADFAKVDAFARKFHAIHEQEFLNSPALERVLGKRTLDAWRENIHYVTTKRQFSPEELKEIEAKRAELRKTGAFGGDDMVGDVYKYATRLDPTAGLRGSFASKREVMSATMEKTGAIMHWARKCNYVIELRDALLAAGVEGVHDMPAGTNELKSRKRYGTISYVENGQKRTLVVPKEIAKDFEQTDSYDNAAIRLLASCNNFARRMVIDYNLPYGLSNMWRNVGSAESNVPGMREAVIKRASRFVSPGVATAEEIAMQLLVRNLPEKWSLPLRKMWGEHTALYWLPQAKRIAMWLTDYNKMQRKFWEAEQRGDLGTLQQMEEDRRWAIMAKRANMFHSMTTGRIADPSMLDAQMQRSGMTLMSSERRERDAKPMWRRALDFVNIFQRNARQQVYEDVLIKTIVFLHDRAQFGKTHNRTLEESGLIARKYAGIPETERKGIATPGIQAVFNPFWGAIEKGVMRHVDAIRERPKETLQKDAWRLSALITNGLLASGALAAYILYLNDGDEEKAKNGKLGAVYSYARGYQRAYQNCSNYVRNNYHITPLWTKGYTSIILGMPLTDEERILEPVASLISDAAAVAAGTKQSMHMQEHLLNLTKVIAPDFKMAGFGVTLFDDTLGTFLYEPKDYYTGGYKYDRDLYATRYESLSDFGQFSWAMAKRLWNDFGGRGILPTDRSGVDNGLGEEPGWVARAVNSIPIASPYARRMVKVQVGSPRRDAAEILEAERTRKVVIRKSARRMFKIAHDEKRDLSLDSVRYGEMLDKWQKTYGLTPDELASIEAKYLNAWRAYEGAQYKADGEREKFRAKAEKLGLDAANLWLDFD